MELSSATVAFTKGVLGFVADGLSVNTPQVRTDCVSYSIPSLVRKAVEVGCFSVWHISKLSTE